MVSSLPSSLHGKNKRELIAGGELKKTLDNKHHRINLRYHMGQRFGFVDLLPPPPPPHPNYIICIDLRKSQLKIGVNYCESVAIKIICLN